jgi:uncharacterized membrane protein
VRTWPLLAIGREGNDHDDRSPRITTFAGSMNFVWIYAALFAVLMLFLEKSPWPSSTLVVSLEAISLATFVMIAQNRQAAFQQAKGTIIRLTPSNLRMFGSPHG